MRARKPKWYNLNSMKIRQSWNKFNLFNMIRVNLHPSRFTKTHFQQKWLAKSMTRGYHGPHIKESDWSRMFDRRLYSAVDMPPEYLAQHNGSEQAAGRGSGLHAEPGRDEPGSASTPAEPGRDEASASSGPVTAYRFSRYERERTARAQAKDSQFSWHSRQALSAIDKKGKLLAKPISEMTPYMQMAYAPLERRLDVAIFRAMFASSTLQAKQFCTHGAVKVNGKTMRYGAYLLNPGDMFQVDVDHVLYAAGRAKTPEHAKFLAGEDEETQAETREGEEGESPEASEQAAADSPAEAEAAAEPAVEEADAEASAGEGAEEGKELTEEELAAAHKKQLKALVRSAKDIMSDGLRLNPRKKRQLRSFMSETKRALSRIGRGDEAAALDHGDVMDHLSALLKDFKLDGEQVEAVEGEEQQQQQQQPQQTQGSGQQKVSKDKVALATIDQLVTSKEVREQIDFLSKEEQMALAELLRRDAENPIDESKPYWTPWEPRSWMAPFAFIPRYLEVNQNICAAVYLRHPVARRGLAEVPTPFAYETNQLAFNWYLRRR